MSRTRCGTDAKLPARMTSPVSRHDRSNLLLPDRIDCGQRVLSDIQNAAGCFLLGHAAAFRRIDDTKHLAIEATGNLRPDMVCLPVIGIVGFFHVVAGFPRLQRQLRQRSRFQRDFIRIGKRDVHGSPVLNKCESVCLCVYSSPNAQKIITETYHSWPRDFIVHHTGSRDDCAVRSALRTCSDIRRGKWPGGWHLIRWAVVSLPLVGRQHRKIKTGTS